MGIHGTHDTVHQKLVITLDLNVHDTVFLLDGTAELAAQPAHVVNQIVYLDM